MRRDMDIIREIMLTVRDADSYVNHQMLPDIEQAVFGKHAQLLEEAGLIACSLQLDSKGVAKSAVIYRLTWAGHDFADAITNETIWQKAKTHIINPTASWTFGILLEYLKMEIKSHIPGL